MNKPIAGFCAAIALLLCAPAQADDLVSIGPEQNYVFGGEDLTGQVAYDVNSATGQFGPTAGTEIRRRRDRILHPGNRGEPDHGVIALQPAISQQAPPTDAL